MAIKSISSQIIEEFTKKLSTDKFMTSTLIHSLNELLQSGDFKKDDIVKLLKEENKDENP